VAGRKRFATITDVAKAAGVSRATASRVLSGSEYPVSEELRVRILQAAEELDYRPNALARGLRKEARSVIGVIVPSMSNPFYSELVEGIKDIAYEEQFTVLLAPTDGRVQREEQLLNILIEQRVRGIAVALAFGAAKFARAIKDSGVHVVAFDEQGEGVPGDCVAVDYREGARAAAEYLIALGHRRIGLVTAPLTRTNRRQILEGYREAHAEAGLAVDEALIAEADSEYQYGRHLYELDAGGQLTERLLGSGDPPTAIMANNDLMAMGVLQKLYEKNIRVPEEMSVVGFDDIAITRLTSPPLTTVRVPKYEMGRWVAEMLLRRFKAEESLAPVQMKVTPELIVRATTAPPGAGGGLRSPLVPGRTAKAGDAS